MNHAVYRYNREKLNSYVSMSEQPPCSPHLRTFCCIPLRSSDR